MVKQVLCVDKCGKAYYIGTIHLLTSADVDTQDLWDSINSIKSFYPRLYGVTPATHDLYIRGE